MSVQTTERATITMDLELKFVFYVVSDEITDFSLKLTEYQEKLNFSSEVSLIKLIELIWKTVIGSLELNFLLPILFLLYIVLFLPVTVNKLLKKYTF